MSSTSHDVSNSSFTNNPVAIEIDTAGTYGFTDMLFSGNTFDIENSVNATTADSYADTNRDGDQQVGNGTVTGVGQSFTNGTAGTLSNVRFHLSKTGTPTGNMVARLYALADAIGGGNDVPTGAVLAESDDVDISALDGTPTLTQFNFQDEYAMAGSTDYFIALEESTGYTGDVSNHVLAGRDASTPTATGNMATESGTWSAVSGTDLVFFVSRDGIVKINATDSDPGTFTNTGSPPGGTVIVNTVTLTVTCRNTFGNAVSGVRVRIQTDPGGVLISEGETNASGVFTDSYNYTGDQDVGVRARLKGYNFVEATATIESGGLSVPFTLIRDAAVNLP